MAGLDALVAPSHAAGPPRIEATQSPEQLARAATEFESFFLSQVLEAMFAGIRTDGPFGGGHGEGVFRSLLLQEYGRTLAQQGGIGIADAVQRQLLSLQEVQP